MNEAHGGELIAARHALITQRLRRRRDDLGLTQKQIVTRLARCGLQTTNRALSSLEHGSGLDVAKLPELAVALDCTVTYLIGLTDDPHRWEPDQPAALPPRRFAPPAVDPAPRAAEPAPAATDARHQGPEALILGSFIPAEADRRH
jgi:transcriptional regulator with XRE-family HTH domain